MSNFDSDGVPENDGDDRGELAWNEFDWERYLREQDEAVNRYLALYEAHRDRDDRIDVIAEKMSWAADAWREEEVEDSAEESDETATEDVYTLHKNPIFIATKAIYLGLDRSWLELAKDGAKVPSATAVTVLSSLHRGEETALQAIHALDFGDYAMAVTLFKRALTSLNATFALLGAEAALARPAVATWREQATPALFDLREIWLRVMSECRAALERPSDETS
jgi:hypothetical protein